MRPHCLAHGVRQDGPERRGGEHERERGIAAEEDWHQAANDSPTQYRRQGVAKPTEPATRAAMVLGERAQAPRTGGHRILPEWLRPSDSPTRFRLRAKRFGETSP